jgi:Zn-dependent M28 family amino/carboxypeptidase
MEAARALRASGVRPVRTIRFVLFTGEEQGLLGAKAYVQSHAEVMAKTSAFLNMDMGTNPISGLVGTEAMRADLSAAFAPLASLDPSRPFALTTVASFDPPTDCGSSAADTGAHARPCSRCPTALPKGSTAAKPCSVGCASDHAAFLRAGVPAFTFQQTGPADYARTHHTEYDTEDALDLQAIQHSAVVLALAADGIADLPQPLSRTNLVASAPAGPTPSTGAAGAGAAPQPAPAPCVPSCATTPH